jgi:glucose 1-dehydrogenase
VSNPVCLVTGSSSGIGAAVVDEFARHGYDIVVNYNSGQDRAEAIAEALRQNHGVQAICIGANLADRDAPFRLVDEAVEHFGRLDVAVSNSGVANYIKDEASGELIRYRFHECPPEHLDLEMARVLDLNLKGAYRFGQRALKHMIDFAQAQQKVGEVPRHRSLLFITSVSDIAPETTRIPYGVSKAGLNHAVIAAAFEGGPHNITSNALRPGVVDTPLTARPSGITDPATGEEFTVAQTYGLMAEGGSQALPWIANPEDIAVAAYAFTQIPYMTGQLVAVDGGFTLAGGFPNRELFLNEGLRRRQG